MATHAAEPTAADNVGDLLAAVRKHGPLTIEILGVAAGIVAMSLILIDVRQITAGVVLLFGGLFTEVLLVCWRAMRAPWDKLTEEEPPSCARSSTR